MSDHVKHFYLDNDHPLYWMFEQLVDASFKTNRSDQLEAFSHVDFVCQDFYSSGCFGGNCEGSLQQWEKLDTWVGKDFMEWVKYIYENDIEVSDKEAMQRINQAIEDILDEENGIDFDYKPPKRKRDEPNETEARARLDRMFNTARTAGPVKRRRVTKPYKCSKCGQPKKGHKCPMTPPNSQPKLPPAPKKPEVPVALYIPAPEPEAPEPESKFAVTRADFMQYRAYQRCSAYGLPQWFMTDDAKASEVMNKYDQLATYYN